MRNAFFLVNKDSPAFELVKKNIEKMKPGAVIPVSAEELNAWRKDVEIVYLPDGPPRPQKP